MISGFYFRKIIAFSKQQDCRNGKKGDLKCLGKINY